MNDNNNNSEKGQPTRTVRSQHGNWFTLVHAARQISDFPVLVIAVVAVYNYCRRRGTRSG
jgi:hypothetical protein